jgi:hypothetical protein
MNARHNVLPVRNGMSHRCREEPASLQRHPGATREEPEKLRRARAISQETAIPTVKTIVRVAVDLNPVSHSADWRQICD